MINRRQWLYGLGVMAGAAAQTGVDFAKDNQEPQRPQHRPLDLSDFEPRSMLRVHESRVERAKFPVLDFHTHITKSARSENGVELASERKYLGTPEELLAVMDRRNIRAMVNLTGGYDKSLDEVITKYDRAFPGRFYTFTEPCYERWKEPNYPQLQAHAIEQAHRQGARGLKILKTLGLYLRENITSGALVKVDDPRLDPMWDACSQFNMPVAIHVSDPVAFFTPTDRFNERYEELNNHPDWSFYGGDFPSNAELLEARNRVFARHPKTQFVVLHVGNFGPEPRPSVPTVRWRRSRNGSSSWRRRCRPRTRSWLS
ncbi:MAG: amidohydrolase family protein [Candidatus Sulfotelmatobacter sp.]